MRSDVLRAYKAIHTWTGIVSGLLLFIAFYAGAVTMFKDALTVWATPPAASAQPAVPLAQADALIRRTLAAHPEAQPYFTLSLADGDRARLSWPPAPGRQESAWLDARGQLRTVVRAPSDAARFVDVLHMTAGIPGSYAVGMGAMGVVSLLYGLALVSGVIVLLPTLAKDLFALRVGKNLKRMWLDVHNALGVLSLPFHLVMALSVVAFGLGDYVSGVQDTFVYDGTLKPLLLRQNPYYASAPGTAALPAMLPPERLLARVRQRAPRFVPTALVYRHALAPGRTVFVAGHDDRYLARDGGFALMDPATGAFLNDQFLPGRGNGWSAATSAFYALHFGSYGGAVVRWCYFFLGLAGAGLFYTGNLLWIESRRRNQRPDGRPVLQRRAAFVLAALTVGVPLGCVCGVSLTIAAGKLLAPHVGNPHAWHAGVYYATFAACIAWGLARGGARASVELPALAAIATAAIPAASVIGWLAPSTGLWASTAPGVDAVAALGALGFGWIATRARRRVATGGADSVWSLPARRDAQAAPACPGADRAGARAGDRAGDHARNR
ncbi:PepSY domain-containing protein [Burkholderia sp. WAC0059]|uniref:PepSY-associated TM helix domain-containing protein n=1 Tax=Burkholderia sp. WAC0059 TaxID=2066022 RepID=UPI000C7EEA44|nr:PepSY-associated TM helix domain-containing protein [Burkholderia sp. WAC0059]PLZ02649.1 PepSY domain-containing protein [Burkholderia sp. WAC0059]